ncbi:hypothetical protein BIFGAL_04159 [Bifidobacterium gallicum DSM 20093 = LMG 11596]|uniref:Uncharacterized protein n=1 Tax=Bifidobacterium gallicum DSM 20093 = LMG 11596 TaxID=561180 RepID=D1NWB2_9BIFI|nr:hypothetical protein BIFGAL_04159 [Bifidobacterium gallicum DSM 20093 = LMG 11596]
MRFRSRNGSSPDHAGQGRRGLRAGMVVLLTSLVRGGAVWGSER